MNLLRRGVAALILVGLGQACATGGETGGQASESVGEARQAITTACSFDTLGLPCDPDGPAGPRLECEGFCSIQVSGYVTCTPVTVVNQNNGVVCGTSNAVGDSACKRYCSGKTCLAATAPAGAACRPSAGSNPCEGQCDGAGKCEAIAQPCDFGRREQLCKQDTCNLANATQCLTKNLLKNTICSDADACSIGKCNTLGVCVAGPTVGCNDGNDCTDDSCDPNSGGCLGVNDDTNTCSDGNACTTGEHCGGGACIPGTAPVDCNDNDECTADSCDPNTGCAHIQKSCNDGNACTADSCDPLTGGCFSNSIDCKDNDACTVDDCDPAMGCTHVAKNCDDSNACTADSCSAGMCEHTPVPCDDGDPCTGDSCAAVAGCTHTPVPNCGSNGGAAGDGAGGAAGDSSGGTGIGGSAGTSAGGTSPQAGTDTGGTTGDAGAPASGAGEGPGPGGGTDAGGTDVGGTSAAGGNGVSGSGGRTSGGTKATGGSEQGGVSTGAAGMAGAGGTPAAGDSTDDGGCGCRVVSTPRSSALSWALATLVGLVTLRRRRRVA